MYHQYQKKVSLFHSFSCHSYLEQHDGVLDRLQQSVESAQHQKTASSILLVAAVQLLQLKHAC